MKVIPFETIESIILEIINGYKNDPEWAYLSDEVRLSKINSCERILNMARINKVSIENLILEKGLIA